MKTLKPKIFSFQIIVLGLILAITIFLYLLDGFRAYKNEVAVVFIAKNEDIASRSNQILANLFDISKRLSFYERLISQNPEIKDPYEGLTQDERKEKWQRNFQISRTGNGTIIKIEYFNPNRKIAEQIARQTAVLLSETASHYYNIKTEADFRIVDQSESQAVIKNQYALALASSFLGLVLSYLLTYIFYSLWEKKGRSFSYPHPLPKIELTREKKILPTISPFLTQTTREENYPSRHSAPPANLPIVEDDYLASLTKVEPEQAVEETPVFKENLVPVAAEKSAPEKISDFSQEPSEAEYRERLNKLLRGEI